MRGEQNTATAGCPGEDRPEVEGPQGVRSMESGKVGKEDASTVGLMERILDKGNLDRARRQVVANAGAPGVDKMTVEELLPYLEKHEDELIGRILVGSYKPMPVRRVEIPKPDGGIRLLGVPTVVDRMIQLAVAQVLTPIFEQTFSEYSYGFRPLRGCHDALLKVKEYFDDGFTHVVDIDLAKYFDTVNHDKLIHMLREEVRDEWVIKLIRKFLIGGVMIGGLTEPTDEGVPQGGPLSPLLSNIYLTKFDRLLESRGLRFARYADDCNIYVKSKRAAERVMETATKYLEGTLKLKVNTAKSKVGSPRRLKFLGLSLWKIKDTSGIRIHEKSVVRFKKRVIEITKRNRGVSIEHMLLTLKRYLRGWINYYGIADLKAKSKEWDGWIRRRLRMYIWKQWKRVRTRFRNLKRLGVQEEQAWMWANTRKGYWRTSKSPVLSTTMTNDWLTDLGYSDLHGMYLRYKAKHPLRDWDRIP